MNETPDTLVTADQPAPVTVPNEDGTSPLSIVADHAGNTCRLGVPENEFKRDTAWDIGIAVCRLVADGLDAARVQQNYS